ncbi:MAG: glycogen synthase GlgA [Cocleimonas sp.]|nr:glycogen synthase GlgA [Cocleimonas sp.]
MKVLFASSEVWPLIKTGGLGDVAYSLPHALQQQGMAVRIVLPAYQAVLKKLKSFEILGWLALSVAGKEYSVRILQTQHDKFSLPLWLVDCPALFDRAGNPYAHEEGYDWFDNSERFTLFSLAVARLGMDDLKINWKPDVVHTNDWQTGLVSAFLDQEADRPKRIFTIHNLAYGGYFPQQEFQRLQLPSQWWSSEGVEFYGNLSMIKAGIVYSDQVTTVSPSYAKEICTSEFGYGLAGVLQHRRYKLTGILNGIDPEAWNPQTDPLLPYHYSAKRRNPGKKKNKQALLESNKVEATKENLEAPLLGMVSRLVEQKGVDMIIEAIPQLLATSTANFFFIGTGHPHIEGQLLKLSQQHPQRIMVSIEYSEAKAHLLEAGCDLFMMPSRFEPCGLNQLYSLRYGTLPIVHRTGGLADTVIDAQFEDEKNKRINADATGFVFDIATASEFSTTVHRALAIFEQKKLWNQLQRTAMQQNFSWDKSALEYIQLYS